MPNRAPAEVGAIYDEQGAELDGALCGDNVRIRLKKWVDMILPPQRSIVH